MTVQEQSVPAGAFVESARYLRSGNETVFAILTSPEIARSDIGIVLAHSGANNFSAHRNGVWTSLSRRLAQDGIPSLRFDFAGTGESTGEFALTLAGQPVSDVTAAMDALRAAGCRRLLVVGSCYGAVPSVVASAARGDVAGVIMLSPPLVVTDGQHEASLRERISAIVNRRTLRALATNGQYRRWFFTWFISVSAAKVRAMLGGLAKREPASSAPEQKTSVGSGRGLLLEKDLARLVTTGSHVEVVYGTHDGNLARVDGDPGASRAIRLLEGHRPTGLVRTVLDGPVHGLEDIGIQQQLTELVIRSAQGLTGRAQAVTQ